MKRTSSGTNQGAPPGASRGRSNAAGRETPRATRKSLPTRSSKPTPMPWHRPKPSRMLWVYAVDPSFSQRMDSYSISEIQIPVAHEDLEAGPVGEYIEVVDIDPASELAYEPVTPRDLEFPGGIPPREDHPKFHQQMVYAVAMNTVSHFERALGRRVLWAPRWVNPDGKWRKEFVQRLRIYPHALREANAYYSPDKKALLFGYFRAPETRSDGGLPGESIFSCLSYDIVAHETTHAILDGLHPYFNEPSNPDVLAFHEAFADLVALFSRFSMKPLIRKEIAACRGNLDAPTMLGALAMQLGAGMGIRGGALRDALGHRDENGQWKRRQPDPRAYKSVFQPHARGALLVAAVFDAFTKMYQSRTADLFRIASGGTGILPAGEIHPDLAIRLAEDAAKTAGHVLDMCIRAMDYCPPVDIDFGDYLRALITADVDIAPDDDRGYRVAFAEAFRRHGIFPAGTASMSVDSLVWGTPQFAEELGELFVGRLSELMRHQGWGLEDTRRATFDGMQRNCAALHRFVTNELTHPDVQYQLGVRVSSDAPASILPSGKSRDDDGGRRPSVQVNALRPAFRTGPGGTEITDLVVELTQKRRGFFDPKVQERVDSKSLRDSGADITTPADFTYRGGCTLSFDLRAKQVRYCVAKNIMSPNRLERQRTHEGGGASTRATYALDTKREPFAMLHRG
jgi:hypothetical protein